MSGNPLRRILRRRRDRERSYRVAFIVSAPRSGSTWLRTALNRHPAVLCTENRLFGEFFEVWRDGDVAAPRMTLDYYVRYLVGTQDPRSAGIDEARLRSSLLARAAHAAFDALAEASGKSLLIDKVTPYLGTSEQVVSSIRRHFPEAPIIQLLRDGRDVATSGAFDWLRRDAVGTARHAFFVERRGATLKRFFDEPVLSRWADYWVEPIRALEGVTCCTLRYEEMLADQQRVLCDLFGRLGVDAREAIVRDCVDHARFERMSGGRARGTMEPTAKVRRGVSGDWRGYFTRADGELWERLAGAELRRAGYETDDGWLDDLPGALSIARGELDGE